MKKRKTGKTKYILCVIIALTASFTMQGSFLFSENRSGDTVYAEDRDGSMIRVGLEGVYYNKQTITIRNTDIVLGYSVDNAYYREMALSGGGFTLTPYTGNIRIAGEYSSYEEAETAVMSSYEGVEAYPILTYLNKWSIAVCGEGESNSYAVMISCDDGSKMLYTADEHGAYPQITAGKSNNAGVYVVDLGERQYRGRMEIGRYGAISSLKAVNIVELEEYLYGVVPCEMVSSWHEEALKTQAVCSRSYAYTAGFNTGTDLKKPYILCDTTSSQVYRGYGAEKQRTSKAVDETKGKILYYGGKVV